MRSLVPGRRLALGLVALSSLFVVLGASTAFGAPRGPAPASTRSAIAADWTAFFSAKTPVARRIKLLQDGPQLAKIIRSESASPLAAMASAKVTKVVLVSSTKAKVIYSIVVGGSPVLAGQTGVAVRQGGIWKVGVSSFCGLLAVENSGNTSTLPAVCRAAH